MTEKSGFIQQQAERDKADPSNAVKKAQEVAKHCYRLIAEGGLPPEAMVNKIGSHNHQNYVESMVRIFQELRMRGYLETSSNVLDIGCGCGRLGTPFALFLEEGNYYGMDVWEEGIRWCQENITPMNPSARFFLKQAANNYYYDRGSASSKNNFDLDFCDNKTIDLSFAISVFTHLLEEDALQYLDETRRVLRDTGIAYYTGFVIDEYFHHYVETTGNHTAVTQRGDGVFHAYQGQDFFAGYTMRKWLEMFDNSGLRVVSHELGRWANKPGGRIYQDLFLLMRK